MLGKILRFLIYTIIFLVPVFFLPFTFSVLEFNKFYFLFFLVWIAFLLWFLKMIVKEKEIKIIWGRIDWFVLVFIIFAILSVVFSVDRFSSIFGYYTFLAPNLISLLTLFAFYLILRNQNLGLSSLKLERVINLILASAFLVVIFAYFSLFSLWQKIPFLKIFSGLLSPVSSSLQGLSIYLAIIVVLAISLVLRPQKRSYQVFLWILILLSLGILIMADFQGAWIVLVVSLGYLIFWIIQARALATEAQKLLLPIFVVIISLLFIFINVWAFLGPFANKFLSFIEILPGQGVSWKIGFNNLGEGIKQMVLGSGLGTDFYDIAKFRPLALNQGSLWAIRFDRFPNTFAQLLATTGILGLIFYLFILGITFIRKRRIFGKERVLLITFLSLIVAQLFYYQNLTLMFLFWLFLGMLAQNTGRVKRISLEEKPEIFLVFESIFIVFVLFVCLAYFYGVRFYLADVKFVQGLREGKIDKKISLFESAFRLNPYQPYYQRITSQAYLFRAQQELQKPQKKRKQNALARDVKMAIAYAQRATLIAPAQVTCWQNLANIYRDLAGVAKGAPEFSKNTYDKAIALEPNNPVLYTERGKILLILKKNDEAKKDFEKAIALQKNYVDAKIQLALLKEKEGDLSGAIDEMKKIVASYPYSVEANFQLGRLYFNNIEIDKAISQFKKALSLSPNYANALYSLGLAYEKQGETDKALEEFKKVLKLNPDNQAVQKKIEELEGGQISNNESLPQNTNDQKTGKKEQTLK